MTDNGNEILASGGWCAPGPDLLAILNLSTDEAEALRESALPSSADVDQDLPGTAAIG